jgi:GTP-binding protein EngB required for normal cell division
MPHKKNHILNQCNVLDLGQLISIVEAGDISIEDFKAAGLEAEKLNALELQFCNSLSLDGLFAAVETGSMSLEDIFDSEIDLDKRKALKLKFCNRAKTASLVESIQTGEVTLEELDHAGLKNDIRASIVQILSQPNPANEKAKSISAVIDGSATAYEVRVCINNNIYTFDELAAARVDPAKIESLKHFCSTGNDVKSYKIEDLPPMPEGRTDVFFVGMPNSGKSTMLAGISLAGVNLGISFPETFSNAGTKYQHKLIEDLSLNVLPDGTKANSYNYIPLSFKNDIDGHKHPFNIVEVPGENYVRMDEDGEVNEFLKYIESTNNRKILVFVIDSARKGRQALVYVNILNMFKSRGILEKTDAVYLVVNKFDILKENKYQYDNRNHELIAHEYLREEYLILINNILDARKESRQQFKIKIIPFSIGKVSYCSILDYFDSKYSISLLEHLIFDSFVIRGGKWTSKFS